MSGTKSAADVEAAFREATVDKSRCPMGKLLDTMPNDVRDVVQQKLNDEVHYSSAVIVRVLKNLGFPPTSPENTSKHRRGECRCVEVR